MRPHKIDWNMKQSADRQTEIFSPFSFAKLSFYQLFLSLNLDTTLKSETKKSDLQK